MIISDKVVSLPQIKKIFYMKKLLVAVIVTVLGLSSVNAQKDAFGLSAGYSSLIVKAKASYQGDSDSDSDSAGGFYIGLFKEFNIDEKFTIRPEFQFAVYSSDGDNSSELLIPVMFKYEVARSFSLMAGPQFDYLLDDDADGLNKFGLGLALGAEVDLTEKLFLNLRYSFGVSERLEDDEILAPVELDARFDTFNLGLGYKF